MVLTRLAEVRKAKGEEMTPERLGVLAGVSYNTIRRAEKGKGTTLNNAKAIAKALKVKTTDLQ